MKIDARTRYTLKVIKSAFIDLLNESPINKVTVKELCDKAGINRATFYRYYEDIFDLYEKFKIDFIEEFLLVINESNPADVESDFLYTLGKIKENSDAVCALSKQKDMYQVMCEISEKNYRRFEDFAHVLMKEVKEWDRRLLYSYIASGCAGVLVEWIQSGMVRDEKEIAHFLTRLYKNAMQSF